MKPWKTLERAAGPDGQELLLQERDGTFVIRVGGHELMSSARHNSEEEMARAGLEKVRREHPGVLIGGLGMGYTLRAALDLLPESAEVVVAELLPEVVAWNEVALAGLAKAPLRDARVKVEVTDVMRVVAKSPGRFDAILLDVDNGPEALTQKGNQQLYGAAGVSKMYQALRPSGVLVVWSAGPSPRYLQRLRDAGFSVETRASAAHGKAGTRHTLFVARR